MKIDLDELRRHREALGRIGGHGDVEDARVEFNNSSPGDRRLVLELSQLDEVDWEQLRGTLEEAEPDLWTVAQSAREAVKSSTRRQRATWTFPIRLSYRVDFICPVL